MINPFTPGNGVEPKYLAGRKEYLDEFERSLEAFENGLPQNFVVYGIRGTGKTVLAKHYKFLAENRGWAVIEREFNEKYSDEALFGDCLGADIASKAAEVSMKKKLAETGKKLLNALKPETITAHGISYKPYYKETSKLLVDHLKEVLLSNWSVFQKSGKKGVVLLFDEMHALQDVKERKQYVLSALLEALAFVQRQGCKYLLCACGLPNLKINLKGAKTYSERMFVFQETSNLSEDETRKAITEPLKNTNHSFDKSLVSELIVETAGYPYFIQFYSYYLIEKTNKQKISLIDFKKIRPNLLTRLDKSFFEDRFNSASDNEKKVLISMAKSNEKEASTSEIVKKSRINYKNVIQLLIRLSEKGLIYKVTKGKYAFTLPLFGEYVKRAY